MSPSTRILVVDDDDSARLLLRRMLDDDYEVHEAASGEAALEIFAESPPDVVLLDLTMPGMDGYETCRRMRAMDHGREAKVMVVSANEKLSGRLEGYAAGADDYVSKPFHPEEMLAKIEVLLRLHDVESFERLRARFLNLLAHETRTPLSGVLGPASLLAEDIELDEETRREMAQMILEHARGLQQIIDRTVLLCAFQLGEAVSERDGFDVARVTRDVVDHLRRDQPDSESCVQLRAPRELTVNGDEEHIAFLFETLVSNGLRHRDPGSVVQIDLEVDDGHYTLSVNNTGPGLDEAQLRGLFNGLSVADLDHHRRAKLGLNLALAREIAKEHGGEIDVRSVPGQDTRFVVRLPRQARTSACSVRADDLAVEVR